MEAPRITEIHGPEPLPIERNWWIQCAYKAHRRRAKQRGIEWQMTLEEWWGAWSPHWETREKVDIVMARNGDVGPYSVGNIYFTTRGQNCRDAVTFRRERLATNC